MSRRRIAAMLFCALMTTIGISENARCRPSNTQIGDSANIQSRAIPPFYLVSGWEATVAQTEHTSARQPLCYAIERLCVMHRTHFDPRSALRENRSPLAWPDVFADDIPSATRQRIEARALLDANGLKYRELIPFELPVRLLADSIAASVAGDHPVLINAPQAPVVYGYDRREPDHWWWFDLAGTPEIELESERTLQFTMWSDDAAAGVVWIVSGVGDYYPRDADSLDWAFLTRLNSSVQGSANEGVAPYPLSLRRLRDILASSDSIPLSESAQNSDDPLGILQAKSSRESVIGILQRVVGTQSDSALSGPLRLAEYHLHGSVSTLSSLAESVYGTVGNTPAHRRQSLQLGNLQVRTRALQLVTELLKSEKMAMESLGIALGVHEKPRETIASPRPKRRGR